MGPSKLLTMLLHGVKMILIMVTQLEVANLTKLLLKSKELKVMPVSQNVLPITNAQLMFQKEPPLFHLALYKPPLVINIVLSYVKKLILNKVIAQLELNVKPSKSFSEFAYIQPPLKTGQFSYLDNKNDIF